MEHLGEDAIAAALENAVRQVLASSQALTPDLGGQARTADTVEALLALL